MQTLRIIVEISIILYICMQVYNAYKVNKLLSPLVKRFIQKDPPASAQYEPDELIENWQQGYLVALKHHINSQFKTGIDGLVLMQMIDVANKLEVVKESGRKFVRVEPVFGNQYSVVEFINVVHKEN